MIVREESGAKDRIVRLKDGSLAISFNPNDEAPEYRLLRKGDSASGLVRAKSCSGWIHVPPENNHLWDELFTLDEDNVDYDLRFRMNDAVSGKGGSQSMTIVGVPANSGGADYTINNAGSSTSYTMSDPAIE